MLDDRMHLHNNSALSGEFPSSLKPLWVKPYQGLYIPLTYSLWALQTKMDKQIFSENKEYTPVVYHTVNWLLHAVNAGLVFSLLFLLTAHAPASFIGALFFALHPIQVESVAWVSGFKDLSSSFFSLLTLLAGFISLEKTRAKKIGALALCCFFLVAACLCKPSSVVVPFLLVLGAVCFKEKSLKTALKSFWFLFILILPAVFLTTGAQPESSMFFITPYLYRPLIAADSLIFYIAKILFPFSLVPDYSRSPFAVMRSPFALLSITCLVLFLGLLYKSNRRIQGVFLWFAISLLPVLGLVSFYFQFFSTVADRYVYFALFAPCLGIAYFLSIPEKKKAIWISATLLCFFGVKTFLQARVWRNDEALFSYTVKANPYSLMAQNNYGSVLENQNKLRDAALHYYEALRLDPEGLPAHYNLGRVFGMMGKNEEAIHLLDDLVRLKPDMAEAHYTLGLIYRRTGNLDKALKHLNYALQLSPLMPGAHYQLGLVFQQQKRWDEAKRSFQQAVLLNPANTNAKIALAEASHRKSSKP